MPEHEQTNQKKQGKNDQKQRATPVESQPKAQNLIAWDISAYLGETPFNPPLQKHADLLSKASSEQQAIIIRRFQETYGNHYVQRLLVSKPAAIRESLPGNTASPVVQRAIKGLSAKPTTALFAGRAYNFWTEEANKDKPLKDLTEYLMQQIRWPENCPPCTSMYPDSGDTGVFNRALWVIKMNTKSFSERANITKVGELNKKEVTDIVDTIYHEARHAEQAFRIAQMRAQNGDAADKIEREMSIPPAVAQAAVANKMAGDDQVKGWEAFMVGKYENYKGEVSKLRDEISKVEGEVDKLSSQADLVKVDAPLSTVKTHLDGFFKTTKDSIVAKRDKDAADNSVHDHIVDIQQAYNNFKTEFDIQKGDANKYDKPKLKDLKYKLYEARYNAYKDYLHEKDAWAVGGAAGAAFKKRAK
jgi:hypothetical protein